jgi:hypothetical protein
MNAQPPSLNPDDQPAPPLLDLWVAAVFFVFGTATAWLAWRMPTYVEQKGEIYTAPGLVPGFYGVIMMLISVWLAIRAVQQGALQRQPTPAAPVPRTDTGASRRLALVTALGLVYVWGLIGRVPFWLASAIFVAAFTIVFEWQVNAPAMQRLRKIAEAAALGLVTGVAITLVFEKVFYVRLP